MSTNKQLSGDTEVREPRYFNAVQLPLLLFFSVWCWIACNSTGTGTKTGSITIRYNADSTKVLLSEAEWERVLPEKVFEVTRKKGTEQAYTGKYWDNHTAGVYSCICCGQPLFSSDAKFDSGTGWPSYFRPVSKKAVELREDYSAGMERNEVACKRCGSHLGHVFDDGPPPTGLRYCINSVSLRFKAKK